jgi:hypothetical protein
MHSGDLGTSATCHQVIGMVAGIVCGNFAMPREFSVNNAEWTYMNGTQWSCGQSSTPPPLRNGGYCMQSTAGNHPYAYFTTY